MEKRKIEEAKKAGEHVEGLAPKLKPLPKKDPITYTSVEQGFELIQSQCHKGWITRIKYFEDLNYVVSSSLDGFIHIHTIEDLQYKEHKTFNLH
jgi:hypothetical protein